MKDYSNYHNTNMNEKLSHDGLLILERSLDGFEGYDVLINGTVNSKVLIYQKYDADSQTKKVIGRIEDIEIGNLLKQGDLNWLINTFPEDNKIYRKAEIKLCNSTYPIKRNKTRVLKGYTDLGKPRYLDEYEVDIQEPCVVESKNSSVNNDQQLSILENQLLISLKYQQSDTLALNYEFDIYNSKYKIINFDYTSVINEKGILKITAERV